MKRKILFSFFIVIICFFSYRLIFSYTILPPGNSGDKKHKIYDVFYFPKVTFNPFKYEDLKKIIIEYINSQNFLNDIENFERLHNGIHTVFTTEYVLSFKKIKNKFDLVSIKKVSEEYHILIASQSIPEATLVFVMKNEKIIRFY